MTIACFDSSALVKLVIEEDGSDDAARLWDGADAVVTSELAEQHALSGFDAVHLASALTLALPGSRRSRSGSRPEVVAGPTQRAKRRRPRRHDRVPPTEGMVPGVIDELVGERIITTPVGRP